MRLVSCLLFLLQRHGYVDSGFNSVDSKDMVQFSKAKAVGFEFRIIGGMWPSRRALFWRKLQNVFMLMWPQGPGCFLFSFWSLFAMALTLTCQSTVVVIRYWMLAKVWKKLSIRHWFVQQKENDMETVRYFVLYFDVFCYSISTRPLRCSWTHQNKRLGCHDKRNVDDLKIFEVFFLCQSGNIAIAISELSYWSNQPCLRIPMDGPIFWFGIK